MNPSRSLAKGIVVTTSQGERINDSHVPGSLVGDINAELGFPAREVVLEQAPVSRPAKMAAQNKYLDLNIASF